MSVIAMNALWVFVTVGLAALTLVVIVGAVCAVATICDAFWVEPHRLRSADRRISERRRAAAARGDEGAAEISRIAAEGKRMGVTGNYARYMDRGGWL